MIFVRQENESRRQLEKKRKQKEEEEEKKNKAHAVTTSEPNSGIPPHDRPTDRRNYRQTLVKQVNIFVSEARLSDSHEGSVATGSRLHHRRPAD